jgi:hypothetical protein
VDHEGAAVSPLRDGHGDDKGLGLGRGASRQRLSNLNKAGHEKIPVSDFSETGIFLW